MISTATDPLPRRRWIDDEVIQLRRWSSDQVYPLPAGRHALKLAIGRAPDCAIPIQAPADYASRLHASLERIGAHWSIEDHSKNGMVVDGEEQSRAFVRPGMKLIFGRCILVAESARTIALRAALARMIGWSDLDALDVVLQNLRQAASERAILLLRGEGDLMPCAKELHYLTRGDAAPFVVCAWPEVQERADAEYSVLPPLHVRRASSGRQAMELAVGGTICLENRRWPRDLGEVLAVLRHTRSTAQVFELAQPGQVAKIDAHTYVTIAIPLLRRRPSHEVDRLIGEYTAAVVRRLKDTDPKFAEVELGDHQREWIRERCETVADLQTATVRRLAMQRFGSVRGAAEFLRMSHVALGDWLKRRRG